MEERALSWLDDIGGYLETNSIGHFTTGSIDIFCNGFDESVPNCITLLNAPGQPELYTLKRSTVLSRPELDIRVRNADDSTAETKAKAIQDLLSQVRMQTLGSTSFKKIRPLQDYYFLEQDENNRFIYVINFKCEINR